MNYLRAGPRGHEVVENHQLGPYRAQLLKYEPQTHLEPAGVVALGGSADLSKTGVLHALSGSHGKAGIREVGMIRRIEGFGTELDVLAFADPGVLDQCDVEIVLPRSTKCGESERPRAKLVAQQLLGGIRLEVGDVEPVFRTPLG